MAKRDPPQIWNLDDIHERQRLAYQISKLRGLHEVSIHQRKFTRSLRANRYYFVALVQPFAEWLRETQGDNFIDSEQAHEMLKWKILGPTEIHNEQGEVETLPPRSRTLETAEFAEYVDKCAEWLRDFCEINVLPPELFSEKKGTN